IGYGQLWHQPQGELFAQVLPPVMFGSLTAILLSGILSFLGRRFPELTGEGRLQPEESEELATHERDEPVDLDVTHIAGAGLLIITLYLLGLICFQTFRLPAPVARVRVAPEPWRSCRQQSAGSSCRLRRSRRGSAAQSPSP